MKSSVRPHLAVLLLLVAAAPVLAQQIYRSVGPDGRVTYSDHPPVANAQPASVGGAAVAAAQPSLPLELRQSATRYPVVLYTGNGCQPCATGRNLLAGRGVPFVEKVVSSQDDVEALKNLFSDQGLPVLTIGGQTLKGYTEQEWTQMLNAAGYPRTSQLPAGYRNPPPSPLVAKVEAAAPAPAEQRPTVPTVPTGPTTSNPAGIRF